MIDVVIDRYDGQQVKKLEVNIEPDYSDRSLWRLFVVAIVLGLAIFGQNI